MILEVEHTLNYTYSDDIHLNPHYFYLTPDPTPFQQILSFDLWVYPEPDKLIRNIDQEGNIQHICFVNTLTNVFEVKTKFSLETKAFNTFDFIFFPFETSKFPFAYPGKLAYYTDIYFSSNPVHPEIKALGDKLAKEAGNNTIDFLLAVTTYISSNFRYISRERGEAVAAESTLDTKSGSCRDFSVLMMSICGSQGMVARFVSGYLYGSNRHEHDLHAWVEVFLPGGGWRGFDPTEGQVVNENYITLANSLEPTGINPVRGSFRGGFSVQSKLETHVSILLGS
jgi:transglutaminase-like putative cysteine protease